MITGKKQDAALCGMYNSTQTRFKMVMVIGDLLPGGLVKLRDGLHRRSTGTLFQSDFTGHWRLPLVLGQGAAAHSKQKGNYQCHHVAPLCCVGEYYIYTDYQKPGPSLDNSSDLHN